MEPRAHHIIIGFFTLAITLFALLFTLWLARSSSQEDTRLYDIVFNEAVTGLSVGNAVHYSGIRMGEVVSLSLDPQDPRKVWARIRIADSIPVTVATRARLTMANITGTAIIQLVSGPPDSPPLKSKGDNPPVILAEPSPFTQLRLNSEELLVNITRLVNNASQVLSDENTAHLTNILANLDTTTAVIASRKDALGTGIQDLADASRQMRTTLDKTSRLLDDLNAGYEAHGENLFADAATTLNNLKTLSDNLNNLVTENQSALSHGINGLSEIGPLLIDLRQAISRLESISRRLNEDPASYLLGGEKIEEFTP